MSAGAQGSPSRLKHELRNHLAVIAGFCELLIDEMAETDHRRADLIEIQKAASAALVLVNGMPDE